MRNIHPFTDRQIRLLEAIRKKLGQINDPNPEIITHESYEFYIETTKEIGKVPKISFKPKSCMKKAEIIAVAGLDRPERQDELSEIRKKYGIKEARNREACLFESEWNNIMLKLKKAVFSAALINQMFSTQSQSVSDPIVLLQDIVMVEYASKIKASKEPIFDDEGQGSANSQDFKRIKPYDQELDELE